jgi:uncharacterized protein YggL (DUF469 family)
MKVIVSESQFKRIVNNSNRWGLIGISEDGKPKFSPEEEDERINRIIDNVKQTGEFSFNGSKNPDYQWLYNNSRRGDESKKEKFKNAIIQIMELLGVEDEDEDERINRIIDGVRKTGEFSRNTGKNPDYKWLIKYSKQGKEKFKNAINQIMELLGVEVEDEDERIDRENERINRIINNVIQTGEFSFDNSKNPDYRWLHGGSRRGNENKKEKFRNVINQIKELLGVEDKDERIDRIIDGVRKTGEFSFDGSKNPDYKWLYYNSRRGDESKKEKFKNAIIQIIELLGVEDEDEDERINRIIDGVRKTGEFRVETNSNDYQWLNYHSKQGKEKFKNTLEQIRKIKEKLGIAREYWGEKTTKQVLEQMGFTDIPPIGKYKIDDCRNSLTCRQYKFDVYLPYNETNYTINKKIPKTGIIFEYDGLQHFEPITYFGGDEAFIRQIHKDREKNSYCQNHKPNPIKLVRIPYTSKTRTEIERDIVSALNNPSTFILTGDYPKAGWNK